MCVCVCLLGNSLAQGLIDWSRCVCWLWVGWGAKCHRETSEASTEPNCSYGAARAYHWVVSGDGNMMGGNQQIH